jgi:enoyl-CoA hydratase/carnithine racemase
MPAGHHRPPGVTAAVAASFPSMDAARDAIESLENAGIDGDDIELLGEPVDNTRPAPNPKIVDKRVARHLVPRILTGGLTGAAVGAGFGLVLALVLAVVADSLGGGGFVFAITLVGIGLGAVVGALINFERRVGLSDSWPLTFDDTPAGVVWLAVYTADRHAVNRAADRLAEHHPLELRKGAA